MIAQKYLPNVTKQRDTIHLKFVKATLGSCLSIRLKMMLLKDSDALRFESTLRMMTSFS